MRKITLCLATIGLCFFSLSSNARDLARGTFEIGGDLDLRVSSSELKPQGADKIETDTTSFSGTALSYIADNIALGATWSFENLESKSQGEKIEQTTNMVGPLVGFNISLQDRLNLLLAGGIAWVSIEESGTSFDETTTDGWGWLIAGRLSYFINDFVSLDATLQYVFASLQNDDFDADADLNNTSLGVGLTVYLH